jgi:ATP/ADP translocase
VNAMNLTDYLGKWFKIYRDEIGLFSWSVLLLFQIRSSNILLNNFTETAFLKRFGVEYLPYINVVNSITTFVIMGFLTGLMIRLPGSRLLTSTLMFCGSTVAILRFVILLDFDLLYPFLYVLKTQYAIVLGLIFANLTNDLFNTRQSKRIFPLISAGGIVGTIIGSFMTPLIVLSGHHIRRGDHGKKDGGALSRSHFHPGKDQEIEEKGLDY